MTDKIKTPDDLLAFLGSSQGNRTPQKKGITPRMFGLNGTFRDTGARLKHVENKRGPESTGSVDERALRQEFDYSRSDAARQLVKADIFANKSELNQLRLNRINDE